MANTAANVRVGVTGTVLYAALGTTLPASLSAATTSFTDVGYLDESGINENQPTDSTDIVAWQNGDVCRTVQTKHAYTFDFTMVETSSVVQTLFYGGTPAANTPLAVTGAQPANKAFVINVVDGTKSRRYCIPSGQITERGAVVHAGGEARAYPVTITCYPDASGNKAYIYGNE